MPGGMTEHHTECTQHTVIHELGITSFWYQHWPHWSWVLNPDLCSTLHHGEASACLELTEPPQPQHGHGTDRFSSHWEHLRDLREAAAACIVLFRYQESYEVFLFLTAAYYWVKKKNEQVDISVNYLLSHWSCAPGINITLPEEKANLKCGLISKRCIICDV